MRYSAERRSVNDMRLSLRNENDFPVNLFDFLRKEAGVSKRLITKLKRQDMGITCNGKLIRTIDDVPAGAVVVLSCEDEKTLEPNGELSVGTVFENDDIVVFDKPQGMPVHPSINHYHDTLGNYFAYRYPDITFRPVNRLDRNTSGLCIAAKNQHSAFKLQNNISKVYYAVICGCPDEREGTIDAPIRREQESLIKRCVAQDGQRAVTHYKVLSSCGKYTYVKVTLETGRTHQIRVHFSYIGHPLAGDDLYGGCCDDISGQALHCGELIFSLENDTRPVHLISHPNENITGLMAKYRFQCI